MNKYIQTLLVFIIILILEVIPVLYKEGFEFEDMKWGWIIGIPLIFLIGRIYRESKAK